MFISLVKISHMRLVKDTETLPLLLSFGTVSSAVFVRTFPNKFHSVFTLGSLSILSSKAWYFFLSSNSRSSFPLVSVFNSQPSIYNCRI